MGHWKDIWRDGGAGEYNCTYPDGLSDMGRVLELFSTAVRLTRNTTWMARHLPAAVRIGRYLIRARAEAVARFPASDPRHGLIYGPAEHDTCDMGMGDSPKVVEDQFMLFVVPQTLALCPSSPGSVASAQLSNHAHAPVLCIQVCRLFVSFARALCVRPLDLKYRGDFCAKVLFLSIDAVVEGNDGARSFDGRLSGSSGY